ncbi:Manganese/iron superoxide dismutase [Tuber borchii]|uniref:Superoxide dismutase n=1 Tax=Tuber borchii TaxID=42251 RepID=A0A2T6ZSI1_TUBBO|nr:Manganese/iron superoxide dismutase [Tuber borchii]
MVLSMFLGIWEAGLKESFVTHSALQALEPYISGQIMQIHHSKHHQTYVNNLNAATANHVKALQENDIRAQINLQQAIKFNGGGHINHSLFWANLVPANFSQAELESAPKLTGAISAKYGSYDEFKGEFTGVLLGLQGSGWGWLVKNKKTDQLDIITTKDQDPVVGDLAPIFGVDMWEHAYYLQYFNDKASYVNGIWNIINWETAEQRFLGCSGVLKL